MPEAPGFTNRQIAKAMGEAIGMEIFSLEYTVLTLLHEVKCASHKEILFSTLCSPATLQRKLSFLTARRLIESAVDLDDKRRRIFTLTDKTRAVLDDELSFFVDWDPERSECVIGIFDLVKILEGKLKIQIFENEYKISTLIYHNDGLSTVDLFELSGLSQGSFYMALKNMRESGRVVTQRDEFDKRIVRHFMPDNIRNIIDLAHRDLSQWSGAALGDMDQSAPT